MEGHPKLMREMEKQINDEFDRLSKPFDRRCRGKKCKYNTCGKYS
jgi:hypothetical protein